MNLAHVKLLEEHPTHYRLKDEGGEFTLVKHGLSRELLEKISQHFAEGGEVDDGTVNLPGQSTLAADAAAEAERAQPASQTPQIDTSPFFPFAPGEASQDKPEPDAGIFSGPVADVGVRPPSGPAPVVVPPGFLAPKEDTAPQAEKIPSLEEPTPAPAQPPAQAPAMQFPSGMDQTGEVNKAIQEGHQAIAAYGNAQQAAADLVAKAADQKIAAEQEFNTKVQQQVDKYAADSAAKIDAVSKLHADPSRWWNSRTTGQKIAGAIGVFLGGIGAAITHTQNAALGIIEREIDRDIEAQKENIANQHNALRSYLEQGHNMLTAQQLVRANALDLANTQIQKAAAASAGLTAQPLAQLAQSNLSLKATQARQQAALGSVQLQEARLQLQQQQMMAQRMAQLSQRLQSGDPMAAAIYGKELSYLQKPEKRGEETVFVDQYGPTGKTDADGTPLMGRKRVPFYGASPEVAKTANDELAKLGNLKLAMRTLDNFRHENQLGGVPGSAAVGKAKAALAILKTGLESGLVGMNRQASPEVYQVLDEALGDPTALWKTAKVGGALDYVDQALGTREKSILSASTLGPMQ